MMGNSNPMNTTEAAAGLEALPRRGRKPTSTAAGRTYDGAINPKLSVAFERDQFEVILARSVANGSTFAAEVRALIASVPRLSATVADLKLQLGMANHAEDATRADLDAVKTAIFGSAGYDPTLKIGNFCEMARTTEAARAGALDRAQIAEATVADLTAANIALAAECARLKAREVEARRLLDSALWLKGEGDADAARAYLAGGAE